MPVRLSVSLVRKRVPPPRDLLPEPRVVLGFVLDQTISNRGFESLPHRSLVGTCFCREITTTPTTNHCRQCCLINK